MSSQSSQPYREIPYNYTSFSDREIVIRVLGKHAWQILEKLREKRETGLSSHMLMELLGDIWMVMRNPYIQDDLLHNQKRRTSLISTMQERLHRIKERADGNEKTLELVTIAAQSIETFSRWFGEYNDLRKKATRQFRKVTAKDNIYFDGLARVAHVTDATDWRVELPFVVLTPDSETEIADLVQCCIHLGLTVIPRGGGTGYTGGAIPLDAMSAVINTEKLESLSEIHYRDDLPDLAQKVPVIRAGAGVITRSISDRAHTAGLVFAVDPTSQDASTIGGNVAMNAGGKKAVMWGTTLDNLVSWRMVTPDADWITVERLQHNLGKIHDQKHVQFRVTHFAKDGITQQGKPKILQFKGPFFRKNGLGKDVTNKFLGGLPGIQKEGCDGLITSAEFILHRQPDYIRTVCLEFYGTDLKTAVPAIVEIKAYLDAHTAVQLSGLEHLDERYVKAVNYTPKAARGNLPKMLLLADIVSDDETQLIEATDKVIQLAKQRQAEGFIAIDPAERQKFWVDRTRTAAIAAHTNAFKINEDVVIPLHNLSNYSEQIERINIRQSMQNKLNIITTIQSCLNGENALLFKGVDYKAEAIDLDTLQFKKDHANEFLNTIASQWAQLLNNFDTPAKHCKELLDEKTIIALQKNDCVIDLLLRRDLIISYRKQVQQPLDDIFVGGELKPLRNTLRKTHQKVRSSRLFVALHMHAGDGNIHTNIPVNSNDYEMMQEAEHIVDEIMALAHRLDGVISGEHGIGLTKMHYLDQQSIDDFAAYKKKIDPNGHFNRGKLMPNSGLENAYTPSLRLVEREALLLEHTELGILNDDIKDCLRCGKCKPVCNTHIPRANLLYSPRNKILGTGLMIEAFLYEEQTRRGISLHHFTEMNDVADHCTVCHKCLNPCPVNIDFGYVTVRMRSILRQRKQKKISPVTWASMAFLNMTHPIAIKIMRLGMIKIAFATQRLAHYAFKSLGLLKLGKRPQATTGQPVIKEQVIQFVKKPLPAGVPMQTTRAILGLEDINTVPIISNPKRQQEGDPVFYFPGCGSERLFSQVGMATLAMLYETDATTVLPPSYLCCGYPQMAGGDIQKGTQISTDNRVLFHRIAHALDYLHINTVIVSCGTCMDQLLKYEFEKIFPGCRLLDIHEYLLEKNVKLDNVTGINYVYHDPCHTPIKHYNPVQLTSDLMGQPVELSDRCCGEAGTFAVSRPDISSQLRFRKQESLKQSKQILNTSQPKEKTKILTNCPACVQGLSRYQDDVDMETDYIVVEMMKHLYGDQWNQQFVNKVQAGGIEKVLL
jgi:FAD/FMN-containing dehydrogenase/Fe-S oxidoreductase